MTIADPNLESCMKVKEKAFHQVEVNRTLCTAYWRSIGSFLSGDHHMADSCPASCGTASIAQCMLHHALIYIDPKAISAHLQIGKLRERGSEFRGKVAREGQRKRHHALPQQALALVHAH